MKTEDVNKLINLLNDNQLTELSYEDDSLKITLKKEVTVVGTTPSVMMTQESPIVAMAANVVKAPLVGVFYDKATPDSSPYKSVGDSISKGDVLCIIEAMKVMNEIKADRDGIITKICATDGQAVSYDDVLFELK